MKDYLTIGVPNAPLMGVAFDGPTLSVLCENGTPPELIRFMLALLKSTFEGEVEDSTTLHNIRTLLENTLVSMVVTERLRKVGSKWVFDDPVIEAISDGCSHKDPIYVFPFCCLKDRTRVQ